MVCYAIPRLIAPLILSYCVIYQHVWCIYQYCIGTKESHSRIVIYKVGNLWQLIPNLQLLNKRTKKKADMREKPISSPLIWEDGPQWLERSDAIISARVIHSFISGMHHYVCVAPNIDITTSFSRVDDSEPCRLLHWGRGSLISGPAG